MMALSCTLLVRTRIVSWDKATRTAGACEVGLLGTRTSGRSVAGSAGEEGNQTVSKRQPSTVVAPVVSTSVTVTMAHRGRIQVQGNDMPNPEPSYPWARV